MRVFAYYFIYIILSFSFHSLIGQNVANNDHIASNSNTSSIASTSESLSTGSMTSAIPIYNLELENNLSLPVSLTYSSGNGLPVKSRSGWAGMGWHLSGQFAVSRNIRGADDFQDLLVYSGGPVGVYHKGFYNEPLGEGNVPTLSTYALGIDDSEPDIFTVNLIGQQITFYLSKVTNQTSEWKTIPANADVRIEFTLGDAEYGYDSNGININRYNSSFIITDGLGYKYHFGKSDYEEYSNTYNEQHYESTEDQIRLFANKWYCEKIETPFTNQVVDFEYEEDFYSYVSGSSSIEKSIGQANAQCPNSTHYHDYENITNSTYVKGKRLSSIQYRDTRIEFIANTINLGHSIYMNADHRSKMLDSIIIKQNDYCIKKYGLKYHDLVEGYENSFFVSASYNNYFLESFIELPCVLNYTDHNLSYNNSYTHRFSYNRQYEMLDIGPFAYDFWGYYNGKNFNSSPIPITIDQTGNPDPCGSYSSQSECGTITQEAEVILASVSGHFNNTQITHNYYCNNNTPDGSITRQRSEWEFDYTQAQNSYLKLTNIAGVSYPTGCYNNIGLASRTLYKKVNGSYQIVQLGNGSLTIDMSNLESGQYKISYLSTPNSFVRLVNTLTIDGFSDPCDNQTVGDRRADPNYAAVGLLDTIFNPFGGFTAFEYESNRALTNNSEEVLINSIDGHHNNTQITHNYYCNNNTPDGSITRQRSEWEFDYIQAQNSFLILKDIAGVSYPTGCYNTTGLASRTLYKEVNGSYQIVQLGNGSLTIDMSSFDSGRYKLTYLSTTNSSVRLIKFQETSEMIGGGVRLKSKYISDNDADNFDDITTHYTYGDGRWGHDFLPSISGYLNGNPLIPEISDGNIFFAAQRSVISSLSRSIFKSFTSPVYYEEVSVSQSGVAGYTKYTFSVPENIDASGRDRCEYYNNPIGTDPFINQNQSFISGGMSSYNINNGIDSDLYCYDEFTSPFTFGAMLKTEVYDSGDALVYSKINEFEEVDLDEYVYGVVCERYVQNKEYGLFFNEHVGTNWTVISRPYKVNTGSLRIKKVTTIADNVTNEVDYTYEGNSGRPATTTTTVVGREPEAITDNFYYVNSLPSGALKSSLINKNCVSILFKSETRRQSVLVDGSRTDYVINNSNIVKAIDYRVEGGTFVPDVRYSNWDSYGRALKVYNVKLNGDITDSLTDAFNPNYDYPSIYAYDVSNDQLLSSITKGDRTMTYTYYPNSRIESITDADGEITEYHYDELGRQSMMISSIGEDTLKLNYYTNPETVESYVVSTTVLEDESIDDQIKYQHYDGLKREVRSLLFEFNPDGSDLVIAEIDYNNAGGILSVTKPEAGIVANKYSNSPLQRPIGQITSHINTADIFDTYITYGSNSEEIRIPGKNQTEDVYPPHTLFKETQIDIDGRQTVQYQNSFQQVVRSFKIFEGDTLHTDSYYNVKGLLERITPPEGEPYEFTYGSSTDLLLSKTVPNVNIDEQYWYDNLKNVVLAKTNTGDGVVSVYDQYRRVIKSGLFNQAFPPLGLIYVNPIVDSHFYTGHELIYDGDNNELSRISELKTAILGTDGLLNADNEISPNNEFLTKAHSYDTNNRLQRTESNSHIGATDIFVYTYNASDDIVLTTRTHTNPDDKTFNFTYTNHYDSKSRNTGLSINNKRVSNLVYDNYNRLSKRQLHKTGASSFSQTIDYKYDGFGRLIGINDLEDFEYANCESERYCNLRIELPDEQGITINDLFYYNGSSENSVNGMNLPVYINQGNETHIDNFITDLGTWMTNNGYVYDEINYKYDAVADAPYFLITQSDAPFTYSRIDNAKRYFQRENCCSDIDEVDVFAQKLTYTGSLISVNEWQTSCDPIHSYHYHYDDLGRLSFANYSFRQNYSDALIGDGLDGITSAYNYNNQSGRYSTSYTYDNIGNFDRVTRNQKNNNLNNGRLVDNLTYEYENDITSDNFGRLTRVVDHTNLNAGFDGVPGSGIIEANDPMPSTTLEAVYSYDISGNVIHNTGKGLDFSYNYLGKPNTLTSNNYSAEIYYDASGSTLGKSLNGTKTFTQDFIGDIEYRDNKLFALNYGEGRIKLSDESVFNPIVGFEYTVRDYKGNPRVSFSEIVNDDIITTNEIISVNNYYPYGLKWDKSPSGSIDDDFQQYQGMDWLEDANVYLTENRILDPEIGRWLQVDPLLAASTTQSPYNSMALNPVMFTDREGDIAATTVFTIISIVATVIEGAKLIHNIRAYNEVAAVNNLPSMRGGLEFFKWAIATGVSYAISAHVPRIPGVSEGAKLSSRAAKIGRGALKIVGKYARNFGINVAVSTFANIIRGNGLHTGGGLQKDELGEFFANAAISALFSTVIEIAITDVAIAQKRNLENGVLQSRADDAFQKNGHLSRKGNRIQRRITRLKKYSSTSGNLFGGSPVNKINNSLKLVHESWKLLGSLGTGWRYGTHQDKPGDGQVDAEFEEVGALKFHFRILRGWIPVPTWGRHIFDKDEIPEEWNWAQQGNWLNFIIGH